MDAKEKMGLFGKENKLDEAQLSKMVSEGVKEAIKEQLASTQKPQKWWEKYGVTIVACCLTAAVSIIGTMVVNFYTMKIDLEALKDESSELNSEVSSMNTQIQILGLLAI